VNITRRSAIEKTVASLAASTAANSMEGQPANAADDGRRFFLRLLKSSNESVSRLLEQEGSSRAVGPQRLGRGANVAALAAAYCAPESTLHKSRNLIPPLENATAAFVAAQNPDGTLDAGNLASPPDTAFVVEGLATVLAVLRQTDDPVLARSKESLSRFLLAAGEPLVSGGIHTPNHRWVICSALARINSLFPAAKYVARIDDWLGEGIYMDADGQFAERSPNYSRVTVNAFVTMARLLKRPRLLEYVRRNLDSTVYHLHPNGEIETVSSRRQDQTRPISIANFYLQYRYLALVDRNPVYAAVVKLIEAMPGEGLIEGTNPLIYFLEEPLLKTALPSGGSVPSDYVKVFSDSGLARIRRADVSATVYGGSDWPLGVASGLAHNPTFFSFRKGRAVLQSVRMGGQFFSLGVFRGEGLKAEGSRYVLQQRFDAPYYQPLPKHLRNARGEYALTPAKDGRFWSKLDFPHRQMSNVQTLEQKVTVARKRDGFELQVDITGHDRVPYLVELAFRPGGELGGSLRELPAQDNGKAFLLTEGMGTYRVGDDRIEFGAGQADHQFLNFSGHSYAAHGGTLRADGIRVYITGFTPFKKVITIRGV
jgi:hypothetical protein